MEVEKMVSMKTEKIEIEKSNETESESESESENEESESESENETESENESEPTNEHKARKEEYKPEKAVKTEIVTTTPKNMLVGNF